MAYPIWYQNWPGTKCYTRALEKLGASVNWTKEDHLTSKCRFATSLDVGGYPTYKQVVNLAVLRMCVHVRQPIAEKDI